MGFGLASDTRILRLLVENHNAVFVYICSSVLVAHIKPNALASDDLLFSSCRSNGFQCFHRCLLQLCPSFEDKM